MPCTFSVANAPDTGFQISVNTKFNYKGIALDKNIIYFNAGVNQGSFSVVFTDPVAASTENLATGQVEISLGGDNADIYMLNTITLYFNIIQEDITPPNILSFALGDVTQYSVTATIKVDDVVACYYMVGCCLTLDRSGRNRCTADLRGEEPGTTPDPDHPKQVRQHLHRHQSAGLHQLLWSSALHGLCDIRLS